MLEVLADGVAEQLHQGASFVDRADVQLVAQRAGDAPGQVHQLLGLGGGTLGPPVMLPSPGPVPGGPVPVGLTPTSP